MEFQSSRMALMFLLATFGMLWVPVGQHSFLVAHWMKVGTFLAPFLLFIAASFREEVEVPLGRDLRSWSLWMLVAYIIHQFEEHWVDIFGNVYAFHGSVNGLLMGAFGVTEGPLTPMGIFMINTSLVWLVGALAIWRSPGHVFPALAMAAIIAVNAVAHIALAIINVAYNAGVVTSVVIFLPIAGFVYRQSVIEGLADVRKVIASLIWGLIAHVIMVGGLVAGNIYGLFPELVYFAALIVWSIVPTLLFTQSAPTDLAERAVGRPSGT